MKRQITRLPPHQNGKVAGAILAVVSLPIILILHLLLTFTSPTAGPTVYSLEFPVFMYLLFPPIYFMMGYTAVAFACLVYNSLHKYVGGFEYDTEVDVEAEPSPQVRQYKTAQLATRLLVPIVLIGTTIFLFNGINLTTTQPEPAPTVPVLQEKAHLTETDCGSINGVDLPCWQDYLSSDGYEGDESLPYYPYAKRPNGCSFPQTTPGTHDIINVAGLAISFSDICNQHDRCYYTLGTVPWECNSPFTESLRARCVYEFMHQPVNALDVLSLGVSREEAQVLCNTEAMLISGAVIGAQNYSHRLAQERQREYLARVDRFVRNYMVPR